MTGLIIVIGALLAVITVTGLFIATGVDHLRRLVVAVETIANLTVRQAQVLEAQLEALDRERPL